MTEKKSVLLVGATGETGTSILEALLKDGSFVSLLVRFPFVYLRCFLHYNSLLLQGSVFAEIHPLQSF